ncbi:integrase catalytic domain-containing protein [Trichonephila clavipes]|nr:integrase catalytic domain-containing protein [Trichonephila clavipes]
MVDELKAKMRRLENLIGFEGKIDVTSSAFTQELVRALNSKYKDDVDSSIRLHRLEFFQKLIENARHEKRKAVPVEEKFLLDKKDETKEDDEMDAEQEDVEVKEKEKGKLKKPADVVSVKPEDIDDYSVCGRSDERERRNGAHRKCSDILPEQPSVKIKEFWFPETKTHRDHFPNIVRPAEPEKKMFKNCRKEDLRIVALELELIQYTIDDRKKAEEDRKRAEEDRKRVEEDRKKEAENRLREKELELELARLNVRVNSDNERTGEGCNTLDALVKSVRILTVMVPNRPEGWAFFFASLERAFVSKNVLEKFKSEILLNLLGEKASNVLTYVKDDELNNYEQLKSILREYEPSANQFLEQFKKATRHPSETYIQYTSRLITNWQYYLKLKKVSDFDNLNDLIVSDKIFSSLEKEVASHISVRAGNDWFRPLELAKEIDLYNTSRGKSLKTLLNVLTRNNPVKNASRVFLSEIKDSKCICCAESHPLYTAGQLLRTDHKLLCSITLSET